MADVRNERRNLEIYEKRTRGASLAALAAEFDLSEASISRICDSVRRSLPDSAREDLIALNFERLEYLRDEVLRLAQMQGAPVTAGQHGDVLLDPEDGSVVRDYSLRLRSLGEAHKLILSANKMLGLDAPTSTEVKASVRYEVTGLDPEVLT